jgi:SpoIID/LytB domain protein
VLVAVAAATLSVVVGTPSVAGAQTPTVVIDGGGWGHGRGLSQWGSLGYAIGDWGDGAAHAPWSAAQILAHYYGGTTAGTVSPAQAISVDIQRHAGVAVAVEVDAGAAVAAAPGGAPFLSAAAVQVQRVGGAWTIRTASSCAGPWTTRLSTTEPFVRLLPPASPPSTFSFGTAGDRPVTGDWDGDGADTVAVARPTPANGQLTWYLRGPAGTTTSTFSFGALNDIPVAGDWNGDGVDGIGAYRPSTGAFYLRETASPGPATTRAGFGQGTPITGDWDGNGRDGVAMVNMPNWRVWNDPASIGNYNVFNYGLATDAPVAGDWNGDGKDSQGVRRGDQWYLRNTLGAGSADTTVTALASGGTPLAGRWTGTAADALGRHAGNSWQLQIVGTELGRTLQLCNAGGFDGAGPLRSATATDTRHYRGELRAILHNGTQRLSNVVAIDEYLRGVVPRESPASWGNLGTCTAGRCTGMSQLEAQSVAARSYALAENRFSTWGSQTCDTTSCQVYGGRARRAGGGNISTLEHANTDRAIAATAGAIRRRSSGAPARTEFSSSTGGYTAGGDFPAVPDAGDAIPANPHHSWRVTPSPATVVANLGLSGTLVSASVTARTPADGGRRAQTVTFVTTTGTFTRTGDQVRQGLGLKSTYFTLTYSSGPVGPVPGPGVGLAVRRADQFLIRRSATGGPADIATSYGLATDTPLLGDWNGDGRTDIGVWRNGRFALRVGTGPGAPTYDFVYGLPTDTPVVGDWNGDGRTDVGVRRGATWYLRTSLSGGPATTTLNYGVASDVPVVGDWNGDGVDSPGIWRAGTFHLRDPLSSGGATVTVAGPTATGQPVAADWDGDGRTEVGTYLSGTFRMLVANQAGSAVWQVGFGTAGDIGFIGRF